MRVHEPGDEMDQNDNCRDKGEWETMVDMLIMGEAKCLIYKGHVDRHMDKVDG
jgi:hypothetical protein